MLSMAAAALRWACSNVKRRRVQVFAVEEEEYETNQLQRQLELTQHQAIILLLANLVA